MMDQRKLKRRSNLFFHSTKNGLRNIIVLKNLAQEKRLPFVRRVKIILV